jgi:hypothetical protein
MRTTQLLLNELPYRGDLFLPEKLHALPALAVSQSGSGAHIWIDRYRSALLFRSATRRFVGVAQLGGRAVPRVALAGLA